MMGDKLVLSRDITDSKRQRASAKNPTDLKDEYDDRKRTMQSPVWN